MRLLVLTLGIAALLLAGGAADASAQASLKKVGSRMASTCGDYGEALGRRGRPEPWPAFQAAAAKAADDLERLRQRLQVQFERLGNAGRDVGARFGDYLVALRRQINANTQIERAGRKPNTRALANTEDQARARRVAAASRASARGC